MSYAAPVPWYLAWSVLPFEAATAAFRASGMLLFAAAGNDGADVDAEGCTLGFCWERTWWTPCENSGVICVGGLAGNSTSRAGDSNYGNEQVELFAPFTLWLGPTPDAPGNAARALIGTSFSSPFAAGVAALVWAADPRRSADDVENVLVRTAHDSPDSSVRRYVDAFAAVHQALGNVPPGVEIHVPAAGARVSLNVPVTFDAMVEDVEDGMDCCTVSWRSDVDGPLGTGRQIEHSFTTQGPRTVTVTAVDSAGAATAAASSFVVVDDAPTVTIRRPAAGETVYRGSPATLRGSSFDYNEPGSAPSCDALVWTSSIAGDPFPVTGCDGSVVFATDGVRTLTLTGTDPQGESAAAHAELTVLEPPPDLPPVVHVTSPADHAVLPIDAPIAFSGTATDPGGNVGTDYVVLEWLVIL